MVVGTDVSNHENQNESDDQTNDETGSEALLPVMRPIPLNELSLSLLSLLQGQLMK